MKRGRPRNLVSSTAVCTWLPAHEHDRLITIAMQRETSVSGVVRLAILSLLEKPQRQTTAR